MGSFHFILAGLLLSAATSAPAAAAKEEVVYSCTQGPGRSDLSVAVMMLDGTSLFRGNATLKNGRIHRFGGLFTGPEIQTKSEKEAVNGRDPSKFQSPPLQAAMASSATVPGRQALGPRIGDQQAQIKLIGHVVGETELRPGDRVPPKLGSSVGQNDNDFFDAALDESGNLKVLWWQTYQKDSTTLNVRIDPRGAVSEDMKPYLETARLYLAEFKKYAACCQDESLAECQFRTDPEPVETLSAEPSPMSSGPTQAPLQPANIVAPAATPSFSTASPFGGSHR